MSPHCFKKVTKTRLFRAPALPTALFSSYLCCPPLSSSPVYPSSLPLYRSAVLAALAHCESLLTKASAKWLHCKVWKSKFNNEKLTVWQKWCILSKNIFQTFRACEHDQGHAGESSTKKEILGIRHCRQTHIVSAECSLRAKHGAHSDWELCGCTEHVYCQHMLTR